MRQMVLAITAAHMSSVTAIMGVVVAVTRTQGEVAVMAATVTAEIRWVGGTKKCAAPVGSGALLILYVCELDHYREGGIVKI